jgi:DNA ligase-1
LLSDGGNRSFLDVETRFELLRDYQGQSCEGWFLSPKLDGNRLGWTGADFILRGGGVLRVPDRWKRGMPTTALDGELWGGLGSLYEIQGRIRDGFHGLTFQVFDAPAAGGAFRKRLAYLKSLSLPDHCSLVEQIRCRDTKHLVEFADAIVNAGGEGAVVRDPRAPYVAGRSGSILRWVPQDPALNRRKVA